MELREIIEKQKQFDKEHGWILENDDIDEVIKAINKDLIGLVGEIGEFANLVKKINLIADKENSDETLEAYNCFADKLSEELIDSLIYLIRISIHMNIDITSTYLKKLNFNRERFNKYERY